MLLKRPAVLSVELRDSPDAALASLVSGAGETAAEGRWVALAPHLGVEVGLDAEDLRVLQAVPSEGSVERTALERRFGPGRVSQLLGDGLLIGDHDEHLELRRNDAALRATSWWGPAAVAQAFGRWDAVDVSADELREGKRTTAGLIARHGPPPESIRELRPPEERVGLPPATPSRLDELLAARATCRNFDADAALPLADFASVLQRAFGAQASQELAPGAVMLKKNSPSGGGLHPIDAFVLVQRVDGVAPGLYHYHCLEHSLEPVGPLAPAAAAAAAHELVAGQAWFANAPVLVLMAARFQRNFWKYRNHAKAWKVIQLDAGHLSQTLYLAATELGLGAFVTGAINDRCAERLFGLDGLSTGAIAVCGFGRRAAGGNFEFDPLGKAGR